MGISHKNLLKNKAVYARVYENMKGVDFTDIPEKDEITRRFSYAQNMYRDYESGSGEVIESIPGYRRLLTLGERINGIHLQRIPGGEDHLIVHAGEYLYRFPVKDRDKAEETVGEGTLSFDNVKTRSACVGGTVFIADGGAITRVTADGRVARVMDSSSAAPYIPTTYYNGEEYEERNLLTDKFIERFTVPSWQSLSYGTKGIIFSVTDEEKGYCSVTGFNGTPPPDLFIPAYATVGDKKYRVTAVGPRAFYSCTSITSVQIADGVLEICSNAFFGCAYLTKAYLAPSTERIGYRAFAGCTSLMEINIGNSIQYIGEDVFASSGVTGIYYGGTKDEFSKAESNLSEDILVYYGTAVTDGCLELPVRTHAATLEGVFMRGVEQTVYTPVTDESGSISSIILYLKTAALANGADIEIRGTAGSPYSSFDKRGYDFLSTDYARENGGKSAIVGCTQIAYYDGKLFMSGNPRLPGVVFYSTKSKSGKEEPLYFGSLDFFTDGREGIRGLCQLSDTLAVLSGDRIYCHRNSGEKSATGEKLYPITTVTSGMNILGEPITFEGETVFLGKEGLCAVSSANAVGERETECRSHRINPKLLSEELTEASLAVWRGYLVICVKGNMYLADSRITSRHSSGSRDYEWFYLTGIGKYRGAARVYRYSAEPKGSHSVWMTPDEKAEGTVMSEMTEAGELSYYVTNNGIKYSVYPTEEMAGGDFYPATLIESVGELLFFGTEDGGLFVFNNDKRGVPPERISGAPDFNAEEYALRMKRRIHSDHYSFDGHAPVYMLSTFFDDCGIPYLRKSTKRSTLSIGCKSFDGGMLSVEAITDRSGCKALVNLPLGKQSFTEFNFSTAVMETDEYVTVAIPEKEKRWINKCIRIRSDEFCSPFGISSISYSFTPEGKI